MGQFNVVQRRVKPSIQGSTSQSTVNTTGGGTDIITSHDELTNVKTTGDYSQSDPAVHLTPEDADKLKTLLTAILSVIKSTDIELVASDDNIFTALRTLNEIADRAISKTSDDTAAGVISFMEGMRSNNHDPLSPFGPGMSLRALKDVNGNHTGYWELIVDYLKVNAKATFKEILVEQISHVGGSLLLSPASMECTEVVQILDTDGITVTRYRCYMDENKTNRWKVGDQALCQQFLLPTTRRYWRYVVAVGDHYIDLSATDCEPNSDIPQVDDNIIQFGSRTDSARRSAILITSYGDAGPSITMYKNIGVLLSGETSPYTLTNRAKTSIGGTLSRFVGQIIVEGEDGNEFRVPADKGAWTSGTTAYYYDRFSYNGSLWLCVANPSTTSAPAEGANWIKQVSKGDQGLQGASSIVAVLTNSYHGIPTDSAGNNGVYTNATTTINLYVGGVIAPGEVTYSFSKSDASISISNPVPNRVDVLSMGVDSGYITCTATYNGLSYSQIFKLAKIKAGAAGQAGVSYWLSVSNDVIIKTKNVGSTTYSPSTLSFYPRKQVGVNEAGPAGTGTSFYMQGWNGSSWDNLSGTPYVNPSLYTYTTPAINNTYTKYRGLLYYGTVLLDSVEVQIIEDYRSVRDELAYQIGRFNSYDEYVSFVMQKGSILIAGGYINADLIDVEALVADAVLVNEFANIAGAYFQTEGVTFTQKNGLTLPAIINGIDTSLDINPQSLPDVASFLSSSSLTGGSNLPALNTYINDRQTLTSPAVKASNNYMTIPSGVTSIKSNAVTIGGSMQIEDRASGDRAGFVYNCDLFALFYNGSTLLQQVRIGFYQLDSANDYRGFSYTFPSAALSVPSGANRVYLHCENTLYIRTKVEGNPYGIFVFNSVANATYFYNSTGVYKSRMSPDGYAIARDSNNFWHIKSGSSKMLLSFMGDIDSNSIAQKLLTMSVAASGLIVNVGGYMRKTGFTVGSSVTKVSTGVWRIQHDINSNYGLGPSSYTVHLTIQNGGYNIPGFMYISAYDTTSYNWTEVRAMNKDGVLIDTEFYISFMRI